MTARPQETPRGFGWAAMLLLGWLIAAYALAMVAAPGIRSAIVRTHLATLPLALVAHLVGGAAALALGALQHNTRLRTRHLALHRWCGRLYVVAVGIGGVAALALAGSSVGGLVSHVGFGTLAVLWLGSTGMAYRHVRAGRLQAHRSWMVRSYALTFAAVTLRIYLPLALVAGLPYEPAYQTIAWLCWVPNLLFVEWVLIPRLGATPVSG